MAGAKSTKKKIVKATTNVHVVMFSCPDCTHELEEHKLCPECGQSMRVINVVEKFGEEADKYLEEIKKKIEEDNDSKDNKYIDSDGPTIIKLSEEDHIDDEDEEEDSGALGVIYPDDDQSDAPAEGVDMDFMDALEKLDEEEDDPGEFNELPEL
jgi:ribosomal protein L32